MIGVIGLILAIVIMIVFAYKGLGALPLTILAAFVVIITNGMPIWDSYANFYMSGYAGVYTAYFLLFIFSALYAKIINDTGSATAIGYKLIDWFGKKNVILVSILIISALTYGGVSLFVVIFAVAPIMFMLFKEADLPRHLTVGCLFLGAASYTMTSLPGSPQLTNVIPTQYLGTTMTAAPILGIICSIALFVMGYAYMQYAAKNAVAAGEHWTFPDGYDTRMAEEQDRSKLPAAWKAFLPMAFLIAFIVIGGKYIASSTELCVLAMILATILAAVLNPDKLKGYDWKKLINTGLCDGISAIGGLAAVVAFGTVVSNSTAFTSVASWVMSVNMSPYLKGIFATAAISGITGSSSGGLKIMLSSMGDYFVNSGCNLDILHRLCCVAAGSLDSLPHSSGLFLVFAYLGLNHKTAYKHVFVTTVIVPAIVATVAAVICTVAGL